MTPDQNLIQTVQRLINSGRTRIRIPASLLNRASEKALEVVRQLCKLNGIEVEVDGSS